MALKSTAVRANLYRLLDEVLQTGQPVEIDRRGKLLWIVPAQPRLKRGEKKLDALAAHRDYVACDPDTLIHMDWSTEWKP